MKNKELTAISVRNVGAVRWRVFVATAKLEGYTTPEAVEQAMKLWMEKNHRESFLRIGKGKNDTQRI